MPTMTRVGSDHSDRACIPNLNDLAISAESDILPIGRPCHRSYIRVLYIAKCGKISGIAAIPYLYSAVQTRGSNTRAIRRPCHCPDGLDMLRVGYKERRIACIPDLGTHICAARDDARAIRRPFYAV